MTDQPQSEDFFLGILVLKDGKWSPHAKLDDGAFGTALLQAEELDKSSDFDGVKVMRIPKKGSVGQKEMWVSSRLAARAEAQKANQVTAGAKKSTENLASARRASVTKK